MEDRESIDLNIGQYLQTLKRHWLSIISIFLLMLGLSAYGTKYLKPTYSASGKLLFKLDRTSSLAGIGKELGELKALLADQTPLSTQIEIINSNPLLDQVIQQLNLTNAEGKSLSPADIRSNLEVKIIGGTDIVSLAYSSKDPQEVADIVNALMQVYIQSSVQLNQSDATTAREFITQQLPAVQQDVFRAEKALRDFKEKNKVLDLKQEFTTTVFRAGGTQSSDYNLRVRTEWGQCPGSLFTTAGRSESERCDRSQYVEPVSRCSRYSF
ncbi:MAG: hypothetical protein HC825_06250 [Oscillatoriales cyanobacterium RM1_1_9]|nr:hypothetical protein [Oscillatoriales cyanobacterium RM1_1_9]